MDFVSCHLFLQGLVRHISELFQLLLSVYLIKRVFFIAFALLNSSVKVWRYLGNEPYFQNFAQQRHYFGLCVRYATHICKLSIYTQTTPAQNIPTYARKTEHKSFVLILSIRRYYVQNRALHHQNQHLSITQVLTVWESEKKYVWGCWFCLRLRNEWKV